MTRKNKILTVYLMTLSGSTVWLAAVVLAPFLESQESIWGSFLYAVFSPLCHQIPERCFHLWGFPLAVCSRCFGIYSGIMIGLFGFPITKGFSSVSVPSTGLFAVLTGPILVDTLGNFLLLWETSPWLRFAIGSGWGIILPFYFIAGLSDAWIRKEVHKHPD